MKITKRGYILVYKPKHPFCNKNGWIYEHRLKMEEYLGRYLIKCEVIHHIDGNKLNNFIGNLMLFKNQRDHMKYHLKYCNTREKMRKAHKGKLHTDIAKEKCRLSKLGNKYCVGRKYKKETIEKMKVAWIKRKERMLYATN